MKSFIYSLTCPVSNAVRYIGKANKPRERFLQHITYAKSGYSRNKRLAEWILQLDEIGLKPLFSVLAECGYREAMRVEQDFINKYLPTGLLFNMHKVYKLHDQIDYKELRLIARAKKLRYKTIASYLNVNYCSIAGYLTGQRCQLSLDKAKQLKSYILAQ